MLNADISKELKGQIEANQNQLKAAIRSHQVLVAKLKNCSDGPFNKEIQHSIEEAQQQIIIIGLEQKSLVEKLRREYKLYQRNLKTNAIKNGIEERRFNLSTALSRARKQNIITRTTSIQSASPSEESEVLSSPTTPEPINTNPINPQDVTQTEFLTYFGLATHELYKEIQNKRAERKRRRTANPHFLSTKGWDMSKRKRNLYLASNVSPPNTRQSVKNKNRGPSPSFKLARAESPVEKKCVTFPTIPQLPSGLTIERINQARSTADNKVCIECRLPGNLNVCEVCTNGFHVSCHNRPLVQQPKHCPKCFKELRLGSPNAIPPFSITDLTEKLKEKQELVDKNKELTAELTQLQDKHSQLTISLKTQESEREELLTNQLTTEQKIKQILTFITTVKEAVPDTVDIS